MTYTINGNEVIAEEFVDSKGKKAWHIPFQNTNYVIKYEEGIDINQLDNNFFMHEKKIKR